MITQEELKQLAQTHKNVPILSDILSTRYLNGILKEMGFPQHLERQSNERFYYYDVYMRNLNFTDEQRTYLLGLLNYINCNTFID